MRKKRTKLCGVAMPESCGRQRCQMPRGHKGHHPYWIYSWRKQRRGPRFFPKPGDRLAKVEQRGKISIVNSRTVLAVEKRYPRGTTVVYTRKRPTRPCRCTLSQWRRWAKAAKRPAR